MTSQCMAETSGLRASSVWKTTSLMSVPRRVMGLAVRVVVRLPRAMVAYIVHAPRRKKNQAGRVMTMPMRPMMVVASMCKVGPTLVFACVALAYLAWWCARNDV